MNTLWSSAEKDVAPPKDNADVADTGLADVGLPPPSSQPPVASAGRPQLSRNQPAPPPPHQPPPPAPQGVGNPADSLSLMQLRRIVTEFPRIEPVAYAFEYADTASFEEEIDEWFSYNESEGVRLRKARLTFERRWKKAGNGASWLEVDIMTRKAFVSKEISGLSSSSIQRRCKSLQSLVHIILGVWDETAEQSQDTRDSQTKRAVASKSQVQAIRDGVVLFTDSDGISRLYDVMKRAFERLWYVCRDDTRKSSRLTNPRGDESRDGQAVEEEVALLQDELDNVTTILYIAMETARTDPKSMGLVHEALCKFSCWPDRCRTDGKQ